MKCRTILFVSILFALPLFADDGSWSDSRGYTPAEGALYSIQGNQDIALDKEYLELVDSESGHTRAVFLFTNTSPGPVTVECAFPIRIQWYTFPILLDAEMRQVEETGPGVNAGWDYGGGGKYAPKVSGPYLMDMGDWLSVLGVRTQTWQPDGPDGGGTFISAADYPKGRLDFPSAAFEDKLSLSIRQDGKEVPVATCVVDFGKEPGLVTLHFRHRLDFKPTSSSVVEVEYTFPAGSSASGDPMSPGYVNSYEWNYILETGASWKGPMGTLVLAVPPNFDGKLPAQLKPLGSAKGKMLFQASGWEPKSDQNLSLTWTRLVRTVEDLRRIWIDDPRELDLEYANRSQEGLKVLGASSFLKDSADVYLSQGLIRKAPFDAQRLFDGLRETCWVEGKGDDGIGEYVKFSIDRAAYMVTVQNGFLRSPVDLPEKATWSYFEKNNRVKRLEIRRETGEKAASLDLADSRELQDFDVDLAPGAYRAVIAAVYPGSKWKDTCLGELSFHFGKRQDASALSKDAFFAKYLPK